MVDYCVLLFMQVSISDMPVFCQWELRSASAGLAPNATAPAAADKFECDFVLRTVCCADAVELAPPAAAERELNPAVLKGNAKLAAAVDAGQQVADVTDVVIKVSGLAHAKAA